MAGRQIIWTNAARLDLYVLLEYYIKRNRSAAYSIKLNRKIQQSIRKLSSFPGIGKQTDIIGVRILIIGYLQIIYKTKEKDIIILLLWDSRRNPHDLDIAQSLPEFE